MPYPYTFAKLSFGGTTAAGGDIWSCGLHIGYVVGDITPTSFLTEQAGNMEAIVSRIEAYVGDPDVLVPNQVTVDWAKLAVVGTDGKYLAEPLEEPASWGGSVNGAYIPQAAIVNTLVSEKWKDPGRYNRFYMPVSLQTGTTNAFCLSTAQQTAYATATVDFLADLQTIINSSGTPGMYYIAVASNSGTGQLRQVQEVRVGRIIDTQRRRRNSLTEAYVTVPMPPL